MYSENIAIFFLDLSSLDVPSSIRATFRSFVTVFYEIERPPINSKYRISTIEWKESCSTDMARFYYECNADLRNSTEESETIKPYACTQDNSLYCYCNSQCCVLIQRRLLRHVWEAWYFWLGVALLAVFIISSVSDPR